MNQAWIPLILSVAAGYLLGSINSAILVTRLFGREDIRHFGSGNAGATNMFRTYGKIPAVLTVLGDLLKAIVAVVLARWLFSLFGIQPLAGPGAGPDTGLGYGPLAGPGAGAGAVAAAGTSFILPIDPGVIAGLFVLLGHLFPVYFGFKGGKGVMPAFGIILMVNPLAFLVLLVIAVPLFLKSRIMSLVSVTSAALYPLVTLAIRLIARTGTWQETLYATLFALAYGILVLYSHRSNIRRLLDGTEKPVVPHRQN